MVAETTTLVGFIAVGLAAVVTALDDGVVVTETGVVGVVTTPNGGVTVAGSGVAGVVGCTATVVCTTARDDGVVVADIGRSVPPFLPGATGSVVEARGAVGDGVAGGRPGVGFEFVVERSLELVANGVEDVRLAGRAHLVGALGAPDLPLVRAVGRVVVDRGAGLDCGRGVLEPLGVDIDSRVTLETAEPVGGVGRRFDDPRLALGNRDDQPTRVFPHRRGVVVETPDDAVHVRLDRPG